MQQDAATEGRCHWAQDLDPLVRRHVFEKIMRKLAQVYRGQLDSAEDLTRVASRFENKVFHEANSKEDYLRRISAMLLSLEQKQKQKQKLLQRAASGNHQHVQMGSHVRPINTVHATHGGNSSSDAVHATHGGNCSSTTMSQVASTMSTQRRQSAQLQGLPIPPLGPGLVPNQQNVYPFAPNIHMKPANLSGCNPISIAQSQGQTLVQPNVQSALKMHEQKALNEHIKIKLQPMALRQQLINVIQRNTTMGSAGEVDWREEMIQRIKPLKDAYLSEFMELDQVVFVPKVTEEQLESLPTNTSKQYRFIVNLKNKLTLILKFLQLEKSDIPDKYRGQLSMFLKTTRDVLGFYRNSKARTMDARKSQISHGQPQIINHSGGQAPSGSGVSHQKQREESTHSQLSDKIITTTPTAQQINSNRLLGGASSYFPEESQGSLQSLPIDELQECGSLTPSPVINSVSGIVDVHSPSASLKPTSPSPVGTAEAEASSSVFAKSKLPSPVANPGVVEVASPCASVNSTLPSAFAESASMQADSPACASAKSTLPSPFARSGVIEATSPVTDSGCAPIPSPNPSVQPTSPEDIDSCFASLLEDNLLAAAGTQAVVGETETNAENGCKQVTTPEPIIPALPLQTEASDHLAEGNEHPGNEIPAAKKPIDRLLDAVRTSSPAMLCSAANSFRSVLNMNDWVPDMEMDAFQDWSFFPQQYGSSTMNKMKRDLESTSAPLGGMDGSFMTFDPAGSETQYSSEHGAKRQRTQNAKDTLLDEINSANIMLLDTFISIVDDTGTDGITSGNGGTLIKLFYTATSLAPDLVSFIATSGMSTAMAVKLLVPADYPRSSPVLVSDQGDQQMRNGSSEISGAADMAFGQALCGLPAPMSVMDMARAWEASVRKAVLEFAQRHGGGTFSSTYGEWSRC